MATTKVTVTLDDEQLAAIRRLVASGKAATVFDMTIDADGSLLLAGWFSGELDLGTGTLTPIAERDGVVVKVVDP